jgi:hypothetical protein
MGNVSERLASRIQQLRRMPRAQSAPAGQQPLGIQDVESLVAQGYHPLHAPYVVIQNLVSVFAEHFSAAPECKEYARIVSTAQEEYLPSHPPLSPLTTSYFTTWAFFDLPFGVDHETMGGCMFALREALEMSPFNTEVLLNSCNSRMGIYEHLGHDNSGPVLQELVTGQRFGVHVASGYAGSQGELWYARLCPPLRGLVSPHLVFTTPYILTGASRSDWTAYLRKSIAGMHAQDQSEALGQFLKYGREPNAWNEFIFQAYHHHQPNAVFLAGLPDVARSRPHAPREA